MRSTRSMGRAAHSRSCKPIKRRTPPSGARWKPSRHRWRKYTRSVSSPESSLGLAEHRKPPLSRPPHRRSKPRSFKRPRSQQRLLRKHRRPPMLHLRRILPQPIRSLRPKALPRHKPPTSHRRLRALQALSYSMPISARRAPPISTRGSPVTMSSITEVSSSRRTWSRRSARPSA